MNYDIWMNCDNFSNTGDMNGSTLKLLHGQVRHHLGHMQQRWSHGMMLPAKRFTGVELSSTFPSQPEIIGRNSRIVI
jgi:hypothetical protein